MESCDIRLRVHSIQTLGTLDGPGVRFVIFLHGCNLRCGFCHNPDTWHGSEYKEYTPAELLAKILRYREYFGERGGVTVSGGEPLLQALGVKELFSLCRKEGINTCLDSSGSIFGGDVKELLSETDRVLLDIKFTEAPLYREHIGCSLEAPLAFLDYLCEMGIAVTLRQVILPTLNDSEENVKKLLNIARGHTCVDKIELLPFRKICQVKYDAMGLDFPLGSLPEPEAETVDRLNKLIGDYR